MFPRTDVGAAAPSPTNDTCVRVDLHSARRGGCARGVAVPFRLVLFFLVMWTFPGGVFAD